VDLGVYNLVPPPGVPADFGFTFEGIGTFIEPSVRSGSDDGITAHTDNIPQKEVQHASVVLWGVPGDQTHDRWRGAKLELLEGCSEAELNQAGTECAKFANPSLKPFLTLPPACGEPLKFTIRATSWKHPEAPAIEKSIEWHDSNHEPVGITGCQDLAFGPALAVSPEISEADSPTGVTLSVKPSLGGLEEPGQLATSDIERASGSAPLGFVVNPGQAAGLQACQENSEQSRIGTDEPANCPEASKVGTVKIRSPLLEAAEEKELEGKVYLLQSNPPTIHLLIAASADGVNLKLVAIAHLNDVTGQIELVFGEDPVVEAEDSFLRGHMTLPQLPASDFALTFEGGAKAALDTPTQCGTYEVEHADFMPWATPFISDFFTNAALAITTGPGGGPCPSNPLPFALTFVAGSTNTEAGAFTGYTQLIQRGDGQQRLEKFRLTEPAGFAGMLSKVPLCPEPQAAHGECSSASQIGHAIVSAGAGPNPLTLPQPGGPEIPIYLTSPYKDAPFGLSIATPIVAGPFNLGTIVTRATIDVDPHTAQITITTDPLPQIVDGVPTDVRSVYAVIDRGNFLFNPTNCNAQEITGNATSVGSATAAPISSHFSVGGCQGLKFAPKFSVFTSGETSKAGGASLATKLVYPSERQGAEANIAFVKVELPKQLPSRLTTLQKACTAAQFEANPSGCPAASIVGHAIVHTPVLPVPLEGPAYFVSHGNEAFPSLTMVLQGYGITIDLVGTTLIRKGVTSTTFKSVPDVPFSTFELTLPEGPDSALAANANLCTSKLAMPIEYHAQNGTLLNQNTPITVQGCSSALSIRSHKVKGRNLTLLVYVPAAGKLTASGKGLSRASKKAGGRGVLTLKLNEKKGNRLRAKVKLSFVPAKGRKLAKSIGVVFGG
jgi:hypothetical protein